MIQRMKKDWDNYKVGVLAAVAYLLLATVILGEACPTMIFFKMPCPGCGLTRAFFYLVTFRWKQAWHMNPVIFPFVLFAFWCIYFRYIRGKKIPFFYGGIAILCVACILRFLNNYIWLIS